MTALKYLTILTVLLLSQQVVPAQISPPGLGKAHTANWFAVGIRQELDTIADKGWLSMTYVGIGQKSNPDNYNPFYKPAIFVLNQEFYRPFSKAWQYSLAISYRRQDEYFDTPPYEHQTPALKQEFRTYGRFSYIFKTSRIKFIPTFRQEFRKFFSSDFNSLAENFQFRSRFRMQLTVNLNKNKTHNLIASSEQLFSISKQTTPNTWTDFSYSESRFSLYYSHSHKTLPLIFSVGYMNNLVGNKTTYDVHYFAFDIIIQNPFKLIHRSKDAIIHTVE